MKLFSFALLIALAGCSSPNAPTSNGGTAAVNADSGPAAGTDANKANIARSEEPAGGSCGKNHVNSYPSLDSGDINDITREDGGGRYRKSLLQPIALNKISIRVLRSNLKLHEVWVVTEQGQRIAVPELSSASIMEAGDVVQAPLSIKDHIIAVDVGAESMDSYSSIRITVESCEGTPEFYSGVSNL